MAQNVKLFLVSYYLFLVIVSDDLNSENFICQVFILVELPSEEGCALVRRPRVRSFVALIDCSVLTLA